jgi:hypothetical protein
MKMPTVVVALITSDNDYQAEQAASATHMAAQLGANLEIVYAGNDAVNQTQQLIKIIQSTGHRPDAIIVEPVGTEMIQVAKAAVAAGIGWGILNREPEYISELHLGALRSLPSPPIRSKWGEFREGSLRHWRSKGASYISKDPRALAESPRFAPKACYPANLRAWN